MGPARYRAGAAGAGQAVKICTGSPVTGIHPHCRQKRLRYTRPALTGRSRTAPFLFPLPTKTASLGFRGGPLALPKRETGRARRCVPDLQVCTGCARHRQNCEVLPRSWRRGCGFRGWSSYGPCFSFRAPHCLRLSAAALRRLAPARACGRSRLALPGWQREGRFEVGRAAAAGRCRSNRSCTLRLTQAVRRGRMTERFSKSESAPNASTESFSRSLLLGPPYHKQIRRKAPFCAQAPFLLTVNGRFLFGATEKKMGVHSPVRGPL